MSDGLKIEIDDKPGFEFRIDRRTGPTLAYRPDQPWRLAIDAIGPIWLEASVRLSRDDLEYIRDWIIEELDAVEQEREDNSQFGVGA